MPEYSNAAVGGYHGLIKHGSKFQSFVLLILRLSIGYVVAITGSRHLLNFDKTVNAFIDWGVPLPKFSVYVSGYSEMIFGTMIIFGLATRLVSLPLIFNFIVAIISSSRGAIAKQFGDDKVIFRALLDHFPPAGARRNMELPFNGWETIVNDAAFPCLLMALLLVAFGPGKVSIDYIIGALWRKKEPTEKPAA